MTQHTDIAEFIRQARVEALEKAARLAEGMAKPWHKPPTGANATDSDKDYFLGRYRGAAAAADAIRSLIERK